ncbi:MurR/RpiR family transcriptional regulator [Oceanivirga miroungae]|uniref:RpiR family transcriptional regulator n=1 Tax=Oceanivirga miroungae TaxID=1130046 RepID=A0A6I8MAD0_9FUSO|nr:MurR/RpiR family transcriptional regulator [Oceanivirga miroungae]VWL85122.1 RpiR family transcriptional regulator [Oceanivirga miroungae]
MKILTIIDSCYPNLSKQGKKVADYVKIKKQDIAIMSLQEISREIKVSEATITRFTRKLGFQGFTDFKLELAREDEMYLEKTNGNYMAKIANNISNMVSATKDLIDINELNKAIGYIENSKNIFTFGIGASGIAAKELQTRFLRFGKIIISESINHFQIMYSSILNEKDLVIAISLTGDTKDLIYPIEIAKKNGCKVIAITNHLLSPLAKLADATLLTAGRETPLDGGSLVSKISQLYVVDLLATGYAMNNKCEAIKSKEKIALSIAKRK